MYSTLLGIAILASPPEHDDEDERELYREAIAQAYVEADPSGVHPEWKDELWRICMRESWCGRWGTPERHDDAWAGRDVWATNVAKGRLNPRECEVHRLSDYTSIKRLVKREWGKERAAEFITMLDGLPKGERTPAQFSTQGGFGMMAGTYAHHLGACVAPEELRDPYKGATVALAVFNECERWEQVGTRRIKRKCTCQEHVAIWVGLGNWTKLTNMERRSSAAKQCGPQPSLTLLEWCEDVVMLARRLWAFIQRL